MRTNGRGFTLAELIVASTATVLVCGATVGILRSVTAVRERTTRQMSIQQETRAAVGAIVTALRNVHRVPDEQTRLMGADDVLGEDQIPPAWPDDILYPADRLRLFTVTKRATRPGEPESNVKECEFFLATPDPERPPMLMQRIDPTRNPRPDGGGVVLPIAEGVMGLDIAYHDGEQWLGEWTEENGPFPLAVRIRVILTADPEGRDPVPITRIVTFPYIPVGDEQSTETEV